MNVGQAVLYEGETLIVKQIDSDSKVTLRDTSGGALTVNKENVMEV